MFSGNGVKNVFVSRDSLAEAATHPANFIDKTDIPFYVNTQTFIE